MKKLIALMFACIVAFGSFFNDIDVFTEDTRFNDGTKPVLGENWFGNVMFHGVLFGLNYDNSHIYNSGWMNNHDKPEISGAEDADSDILEAWIMGFYGRDVRVMMIDELFDPKDGEYNVVINADTEHKFYDDWGDLIPESVTNTSLFQGQNTTHGTRTLSVLNGRIENNAYFAGVAPEAKMYLYHNEKGVSLNWDDVFDFIEKYKIQVVSCSFGGGTFGYEQAERMREITEKLGTIFVFASGNDGKDGDPNDATYFEERGGAIFAGAVNSYGKRAWFSNYGGFLDFVALGVDLGRMDTYYIGEKYNNKGAFIDDGTSFSTPIVAGVIALMLEANPDLKRDDIVEILAKTAKKPGDNIHFKDINVTYISPNAVANYDFDYCENGGADENETYMDGFPQKHDQPFETRICTQYKWNNEIGYGIVDAEYAVREAMMRIQNPNQAMKILVDPRYSKIPQSLRDILKEKALQSDYANPNESVVKDISGYKEGWSLVGANAEVNPQDVIDNGAKVIWIYRDGEWQIYTDDSIKADNIPKIDTIHDKEGFWILK